MAEHYQGRSKKTQNRNTQKQPPTKAMAASSVADELKEADSADAQAEMAFWVDLQEGGAASERLETLWEDSIFCEWFLELDTLSPPAELLSSCCSILSLHYR